MDTEVDEQEVIAAGWHLVLNVQKAQACYERGTKQHQDEQDALEQPENQQ